jgi:hypothetical protein
MTGHTFVLEDAPTGVDRPRRLGTLRHFIGGLPVLDLHRAAGQQKRAGNGSGDARALAAQPRFGERVDRGCDHGGHPCAAGSRINH